MSRRSEILRNLGHNPCSVVCTCGWAGEVSVWPVHCRCGRVIPGPPAEPPIDFTQERRDICLACPNYLPQEDGCGELKARGKGYRIMGIHGIPNPKARCPCGYWKEVPPT